MATHPATTLVEALTTDIASQSFASGAIVSWKKVPTEHLESVASESRITLRIRSFKRERTARGTFREEVVIQVSVHRLLGNSGQDALIQSMLDLSYDLAAYINDYDASGSGWARTPDNDSEPFYSSEEINKTGEFQSHVEQQFFRWVDA